jgi:galactokinase
MRTGAGEAEGTAVRKADGAGVKEARGAGDADAGRWFARCYGREPEGVWFAPGRVNLMGGPDYTEVFVLPFALGTGVYAAASRRGDGRIALASRQVGGDPVLLSIGALAPGAVGGWAAYPAGAAWALREAGHLAGGADIAVDADLPAGAGLSSSAALGCAVALALTGLYGLRVPGRELAALARRGENDFAGVPTGIMDQLAAFLCRAGHALLLDCRTGDGTAIPLSPADAGLALLVIDTRVRHTLADGRYAARRQACADAAATLGVRALRDLTDDTGALARLATHTAPGGQAGQAGPVLPRVRHVLSENRRVLAAAELLRAGDQAGIGPLLTASHRSLRDRFEVSWPQADAAVEAATGAGAAGARMTGGGFGGSVIGLVPAGRARHIRRAVAERFARHGWQPPRYLDAVPSGGARRVR